MAVPPQSDVPTFLAPSEAQRDYVRGQIVVRFHTDAAGVQSVDDSLELLERQAGAHTVEPLPGAEGLTVVHLDDDAVSPELLRDVESSPAVAFAERVPARWLSAEAADPRHNRQWGLRAIRWFDTEEPSAGDVTVAICDTGVDGGHPDLAGAIASYDHEGAGPEDIVGHGTHVSGIVAAHADNAAGVVGVAGSRVAMWKVFPDEPLDGNFYVASTNLQSFKLAENDFAGLEAQEISQHTVPPDFRNRRIHRCWKAVKR